MLTAEAHFQVAGGNVEVIFAQRKAVTLVLPDLAMSSRVSVSTGDAVSELMRRMLEPVISTRSSVAAFWAHATGPALSITPPQAIINAVQRRVFLMEFSGQCEVDR